jgi:hypothetical protein
MDKYVSPPILASSTPPPISSWVVILLCCGNKSLPFSSKLAQSSI